MKTMGKKGQTGGTIKPETREVQDFIDALRLCLGLEPLYRKKVPTATDWMVTMLSRTEECSPTNRMVTTRKTTVG